MALVLCPECSNNISDTVASCIHCGYVIAPSRSKISERAQPVYVVKKVKRGRNLGIASMVLGIIGLCFIPLLATDSTTATGFAIISVPTSFLAFIFSLKSREAGYKSGVSLSGVVMSIISLCLLVIIGFTRCT